MRAAATVKYRGVLVGDTGVVGERKCDGIIPAHGSGAIQVSRRRWMFFYATLDPQGWDATRSILYQLRADSPAGRVIDEGLIAECASGWDPLDQGISLRKIHGMPMAFGVPKGAMRGGSVLPNHNVFVVKWYRQGLLERDGRLYSPHLHEAHWSEGGAMARELLRVEWMQFRLNDAEDGIEILAPPDELRQHGYETGDAFCSLGPKRFMCHAMTPPIPADDCCSTWWEVDTFDHDPIRPVATHGRVAAVEYKWDAATGLYRWTRTGALQGIPGRTIGETSISHMDGSWIVAARSFVPDESTLWYHTEDPFAGLGGPVYRPSFGAPRHSYRCADGVLRLFTSGNGGPPRDPLILTDVDPSTFSHSEPRVVFDGKLSLPFEVPFIDHAKLSAPWRNRQMLTFRAIDRCMTSDEQRPPTPEAIASAGIHFAEIVYPDPVPDAWTFALQSPKGGGFNSEAQQRAGA